VRSPPAGETTHLGQELQPHTAWDFTQAALEGSSYYRLPKVLQWFTGNIGFHHIYHLNSRIPNYHLPVCHSAEPSFRRGATFGLPQGFKCASLKLWDAKQRRPIGFAEACALRRVSCTRIDANRELPTRVIGKS